MRRATPSVARPELCMFDLDGVLIDSAVAIRCCLDIALEDAGLAGTTEDEAQAIVGPPLALGVSAMLQTRGDDVAGTQGIVDRFRAMYRDRMIEMTDVQPGVHDMLGALRAAGFRMTVATSKPAPSADVLVQALGLAPYFSAVFAPSEAEATIGKEVLLRRLLRSERVAPAASVMVGDRHHDIDAAHAVGALSIAVTWGYGSTEELLHARPTSIVDDPRDLQHLLLGGSA